MIKVFYPFLIISCFLIPELRAQDFFDEDARFWLYLKLNKKLDKRLQSQLVIQNRFNNNITEYSQLNTNLELKYKLNKHVKLMGGYVLGNKRKPEGHYLFRHQAYLGFLMRQKMNRFGFIYRNLVQAQTPASYNREKALVPKYFDRNKLTVKYEINKYLETYVAAEVNLPLSKNYQGLYINRLRTFTGLQFNLSRRSYLETYFLYQRKYLIKRGGLPRDYIYGLTYSYTF
jgi:hypothetical protein